MNTSKLDRYSLKQYTRLIISFFCGLLILTISQYAILYFKGVVDSIVSSSLLIAIAHQLGFASIIGVLFVFGFNFWENFRPKYGFNIVFVLLSLLLIIEALLIGYYCTALVPLGSDLLGYSFADIKETISNSGGVSFLPIIAIIMILVIFWGLYKLTSKYYHFIGKMYPLTIVFFSLFISTLFLQGKPINLNKTQYLALNLYTSSTEDNTYAQDVEYPLIKNGITPNVLGEYFDLKEEKPNIVFIIVEGLGRDFVGEGAEFPGFTPFLDELSTRSLYWENCLSTTGRTFGVLPSLLGSLPFGKKGFMELDDYPNKLTLFSILKNNGYHTSFYQGTNGSFDGVDRFLKSENVDFVLDKFGFGTQYQMQAKNAEGSTWGYPDQELFKKSMSFPRQEGQSRLEVYMTISNHEPFIPPRQEFYKKQVKKILASRSYETKTEKIIKKNDNIFATLLYTDDALKFVLEEYKKQPDYDNTIFLITGDHRLIPIPQRNNLSRFHVPLIIHSPLLKTNKKISSISSHFDVTPTLLALLQSSYELKMPKKVAWVGDALDTHEEFRSVKNIPLMRNKNELKEYISEGKLYSDGSVYNIDEYMNLGSTMGGSNLENKLQAFKSLNNYVTTNDKIIPDSLAIFTIKKEKFTDGEMVFLNSLNNDYNSDVYYLIARDYAHDRDYDKALLVCRYILSERPRHIDTKILMGRINAWQGNRELAIKLLKECIEINSDYIDSYAALFDVYFWDGRHQDALELIDLAQQNSSSFNAINDKVERARRAAKKAGVTYRRQDKNQDIAALD